MKKNLRVGCITLLFVLTIVVYYWIKGNGLYFIVNKNDPESVASVFTLSLMENKAKKAKSLTVPEQWDAIDTWMDKHLAVECAIPFIDGDTFSFGGTDQSYDASHGRYTYDTLIDVFCPSSSYTLAVRDIVLQRTKKGWQVVEWGEICEAWSYEGKNCFP